LSMASTSVVLPWSTWAMMAMLRMAELLLFIWRGGEPSEILDASLTCRSEPAAAAAEGTRAQPPTTREAITW
jgi:hypothetical protein